MANIEERVETLVKDSIENLGYSLYDVQYVKEGQDYYLRIFIEKPNGSIDLNDCEKVNNEINDLLDEADYIKEQYFLEVSSTGLEKVLRKDKHLQDNIGEEVQVNLFKPVEIMGKKQKEIVGVLKDFDKETMTIEVLLDNYCEKKKKQNNKKDIKGNKERMEENPNQEKQINIERKNISQIKTVFDWDSLEQKHI